MGKITFKEINNIEDLEIKVYADAERTNLIGAVITDNTGEAEFTPPEIGTYYYTIEEHFYKTQEDSFGVEGIDGFYLPSKYEIKDLRIKMDEINFDNFDEEKFEALVDAVDINYWSSTEAAGTEWAEEFAWMWYQGDFAPEPGMYRATKDWANSVRAVKKGADNTPLPYIIFDPTDYGGSGEPYRLFIYPYEESKKWSPHESITGATDEFDGEANTAILVGDTPTAEDYPAAEYCSDAEFIHDGEVLFEMERFRGSVFRYGKAGTDSNVPIKYIWHSAFFKIDPIMLDKQLFEARIMYILDKVSPIKFLYRYDMEEKWKVVEFETTGELKVEMKKLCISQGYGKNIQIGFEIEDIDSNPEIQAVELITEEMEPY